MTTKLTHYLETWNLSDPEPLAETATSQVYVVTYQSARVVLKMLTPVGIDDEKGTETAICYS